MEQKVLDDAISFLISTNPNLKNTRELKHKQRDGILQKVLIANRGEIAKRFFLSLREEGIPSVAVVTEADIGQSWYEFADEFINIGGISNYVNIPIIIACAIISGANAIYPGYGFLSENAEFVASIKKAAQLTNRELIFMGPDDSVMNRVGDKLSARKLAKEHGVPLFEGSNAIRDIEEATKVAKAIGYPVIVKLSSGGGGKGMMPVFHESSLFFAIESAKRIGQSLYNDDTFYLEKYITHPVHIEVQIFNGRAVGIRKCAVQRRNQKIVEETGDFFLDDYTKLALLAAAENMAKISGYYNNCGAGTVEFLLDSNTNQFGFLEMNTRLQVEHPVTDQSLGIDLAKWQILLFDGREHEIDYQEVLKKRFTFKEHSIECRIYAEDPENNYAPSPGTIQELELPAFNGIRCDFGFKKGDRILPHYDPMIGKIISRGPTRQIAISRMERALSEIYVYGINTNVNQLLLIFRNPDFLSGNYTNRLLEEHTELVNPKLKDSDVSLVSIFSALLEYENTIKTLAANLSSRGDFEISSNVLNKIPRTFKVDIAEFQNQVHLIQIDLETFDVFLNKSFVGRAEIQRKSNSNFEFNIRFGLSSYNLRIDSRAGYSIIRVKNTEGKMNYFRVKVTPEGEGATEDPIGMVRAPFQGSFVRFARDEIAKRDRLSIGSYIKEGSPVIIISAMKMETVITAPISGKISYLIEEGDLSRLQIGMTPRGQIIGRNILEGEVLFVIQPSTAEASISKSQKKTSQFSGFELTRTTHDKLNSIYSSNEFEKFSILEKLILIQAYFLGFSVDESILEKITQDPEINFAISENKSEVQKLALQNLQIYYNLKRLYSSTSGRSISLYNELNTYTTKFKEDGYHPSEDLRHTLGFLFSFYKITTFVGLGVDELAISRGLLFIQRGYNRLTNDIKIFQFLCLVSSKLGETEAHKGKIQSILRKIYFHEESEIDNSKAEWLRTVIFSDASFPIQTTQTHVISRKYFKEYKMLDTYDKYFSDILGVSIDWKNKIISSLSNLQSLNLEENAHPRKRVILQKFQKTYSIHVLFSPIENLECYSLVNQNNPNDKKYLIICQLETLKVLKDSSEKVIGIPNVEVATINSSFLLKVYQEIEPRAENQIEFIAVDEPCLLDLGSSRNDILNYYNLYQINLSVNHFLKGLEVQKVLIHVLCQSPYGGNPTEKLFQISVKKGKVVFDLLYPEEQTGLYVAQNLDSATLKLLEKDKWPIEFWVEECFRAGSAQEVKIPTIDDVIYVNPKTNQEEIKKVAAKIYVGIFGSHHAVFFMKDSRINGGATGDLEGLKYVASLYIAYKLKVPIYVWNDGAGANIREGVISLVRAGQGFMMNTLLSGLVNEDKFNSFTKQNVDPRIVSVLEETNKVIQSMFASVNILSSRTFTIAVGIGSSAGLDVYGSSQAALQVMLDSPESYRVLTGSNVIESVTGEKFTNYQIGGAKVMGRWTGTVDVVAEDKLSLISILRKIHRIFAKTPSHLLAKPQLDETLGSGEVISESSAQKVLDEQFFLPIKSEYHGAGSVIGGFGRLLNVPVCIIGARTNYGIRSFAAVTKAKELCRISKKLRVDRILIFGERWFHTSQNVDPEVLQVRKDFIREYDADNLCNINVTTSIKGLERVAINAHANVLIYIREKGISEENLKLAKKVATFIVNSYPEAIETAGRILNLLRIPEISNFAVNSNRPSLPSDPSQPYDILSSIIIPIVDEGSFLEFYKEMNDPMKGPSLIVGLARMAGKTIAIIADQPNIMGGAPDAPGTEKFRIFTEFCNRFKIPILMLSNSPGFLPGTKQERLRIQQIGAESLDHNIIGEVPVVSVVLKQNYGGRQIQAFSKVLRPGIIYLAMQDSIISVMGATSSFDLFYGAKYKQLLAEGKKEEAIQLKDNYISEYNRKAAASSDAYKTGIIDHLMKSSEELRDSIISALSKAEIEAKKYFGWIRESII